MHVSYVRGYYGSWFARLLLLLQKPTQNVKLKCMDVDYTCGNIKSTGEHKLATIQCTMGQTEQALKAGEVKFYYNLQKN